MRMVTAHMVHTALGRIMHQGLDPVVLGKLGILASSYVPQCDAWNLSDKDARKVEMLCGPYYVAILKAMEINIKNEEKV